MLYCCLLYIPPFVQFTSNIIYVNTNKIYKENHFYFKVPTRVRKFQYTAKHFVFYDPGKSYDISGH